MNQPHSGPARPRLSRRSVLRGLGAAVLAGPVAAVSGSPDSRLAQAATGLPLSVVNDSVAYPDDAVWVTVVGTELATGRQGHVNADGAFVPVSLADNGADGTAAYGVTLSRRRVVPLPALSGRVYVSMGAPLAFRAVGTPNGAAIQYPAGWVSGDASSGIPHDCMEFTNSDAGMFTNTTMVDMFSVPMALTLRGAAEQTTGTLRPGGRSRIFDGVAAQTGFGDLVVDGVRVIAPGHGLDAGRFARDYLDGYVGETWDRYRSAELAVTVGATRYTGRVEGERCSFFSGGTPATSFARPSTRDVLFCDGALTAPNDGVSGPIAAVLAAGLNRSTLRDIPVQPDRNPGRYYREPVTNHYARVLHENTVDGRAYGFAFDDVAEQASYLQDHAPRSVTLTLTAF